jgi:hypothetical protein
MIFKRTLILVLMVLSSETLAQTSQPGIRQLEQDLSPAERELVDGTRNAIIKTGTSPAYFAKHFKLRKVVDTPADRRVIWEFSVNEYRATVTDSIGYYTQGAKRVLIHAVSNVLGQTSDIQKTVPKPVALRKLRSCIGDFENLSIRYAAIQGRAELVLTAEARTTEAKKRLSKRESEKREKVGTTDAVSQDEIETDEIEKRPPVIIGNINLRTGRCAKGAGLVVPVRS